MERKFQKLAHFGFVSLAKKQTSARPAGDWYGLLAKMFYQFLPENYVCIGRYPVALKRRIKRTFS